MAELKQKEFGVKTQFQTITPQKSPDFRADNIKSGLQLASGLLKAEAAEEGREAAKTLSGTDLSLADVNRNVDIFEESMANNVTDAQVASGGTVTARQIAEIKDATLNQVNLSSRGLQEAINRGVVSHLEASARANVSLQRASNSLVGSLFQDDFRNAFSKVTGNPAGSPALTLTKSPAEVQQEANNKAIVEANASRTKQVQMQAAKDKSTFEQAEFKIIALENKQAEVVKMDALDKENLRSDEEKLRGAGTQFSTAIAPLMDDITAAFTSGRGLDPNEAVSLNQRIKVTADQIVNSHVSKGMGSKAQKALKEQATAWAKDQQQYVDDISLGKVSKELQDIIATGAQNLLATEMPLVYAMAKLGSPQLAQSLALMEPKTRREHVRRLGFNVESMLSLTDEFLKLKNVVDPQVKTHPKDAGVLAPTMSMNGGDANKKILDEYEASGGNLSDLATEWKASPEMSLMTIADSLSGQIESGDKNSVRIGVDILNMSRDKYFRLIEDYDVPKDYQYTIEQNPGKRFPDISFPAGLPDGEQQIIRQMYRAIDATPSLWREEFGSSQEAFTAVMNDGHEFTTEKITKPILKGEGVAEAIAEFGATEASRIRKREGIELTEDRPAQEQLDIIVQGLSSGKLKTTPDVLESITKLTGQLKAEAEAERVKNVPITIDRSPLQGDTPKSKARPEAPADPAKIKEFIKPQAVPITFDEAQGTPSGDIIRKEENPEGFVSDATLLDDGTIGKGESKRDGQAFPYMFEVAGKGWEVDRGFGELIGSKLSKTEAEALVKKTPPIPIEEAEAKVDKVLSDNLKQVKTTFPSLDKDKQDVLSRMLYQGGEGLNVANWKNTNRALKQAIKSDDEVDWLSVQAHMLNSEWATVQTPERALREVMLMHPDTDEQILRDMLAKFQAKRKGGNT